MFTVKSVFYILVAICFAVAALRKTSIEGQPVNFRDLGFFCLTVSLLV